MDNNIDYIGELEVECLVCGGKQTMNIKRTMDEENSTEKVRIECIRCKSKINGLYREIEDLEKRLEKVEGFLTKAHEREYELIQEMQGGIHAEKDTGE